MEAPELIDVEVAIRYRDNPGSVDLSKATKITEKAVAALSRSHGPLILDGILELTEECAKSLASFRGGRLSLKGLQRIEPDGAVVFLFMAHITKSPEKLNFLRSACGGRCQLNENIANLAVKDPDSVELSEATHISDKAAELLSTRWGNQGYPRDLNLNALVSISVKSAKTLAEHQFGLSFNCLSEIDLDLARALSRRSGSLSLNGLRVITVGVAELLAKCTERLSLNGLFDISAEVARKIAITRGTLILDGLSKLSEDSARALIEHRPWMSGARAWVRAKEMISLGGLTEINNTLAQILGDYNGCVRLAGLREISLDSARALKKNKSLKTNIDIRSMFPVSIGLTEANRFVENPESIDLGEATRISVEAAEMLLSREKSLEQIGATDLSSAIALAREKGQPHIDLRLKVPSLPAKIEKETGSELKTVPDAPLDPHFLQLLNQGARDLYYSEQLELEYLRQYKPDDDYDADYDEGDNDSKREMMYDELASDADDNARSTEEGWYYPDRERE